MRHWAVVALEEIVDDYLPISLDLEPVAANELQVIVAGNRVATLLCEAARQFVQVDRILIQVDVNEFAEFANLDLGQIVIALPESLYVALVIRRSEASLRVERPGVISTDE